MGKFTNEERALIKNIVATLSIKRIPDAEIIREVYEQTHKTISRITLFNVKKAIKKESYHWYKTMREGQYEYIHEFKERINEVLYKSCIIDSNEDNPQILSIRRLIIIPKDYLDEIEKLNPKQVKITIDDNI